MTWSKLFSLWRIRETLNTSDVLLAWHRQSVGADEVLLVQHSSVELRDSLLAHEVPNIFGSVFNVLLQSLLWGKGCVPMFPGHF